MPRHTSGLRYAVAAALLLALVSCGDSDGPDAVPTPSSDATPTSEPTTPSPTPTASPTGGANGGTADAPEPLTPVTALLDWRPVDGSVEDPVTRGGDWTLTVTGGGSDWRLSGPRPLQGSSPAGWQVSDTLLDEDWAVVVLQDKSEQRPGRATVIDLATGKSFPLDGRADVPTTNGGTWALGAGKVLHATIDQGAYCLASVDLATRTSEISWCAPKRSGFNGAHATDAGTAILTFDDSQPACRTVATVADGQITPFEGVPDCKAWDGLAIEDGAVWSVIPRERHIEEAHLYARVADGYFDLGPGTAGSLTWCGDAAYFTRDPQEEGTPAALMRWSPDDGLSVAYESPKGEAFIEEPRCGGDAMTVTALTSSGDEQASALLDG